MTLCAKCHAKRDCRREPREHAGYAWMCDQCHDVTAVVECDAPKKPGFWSRLGNGAFELLGSFLYAKSRSR